MFWSWVLTVVGCTCFFLAGKKVWWAWYVGLFAQVLWLAYAIVTEQYGFIAGTFLYTWVYSQNAYAWTKEHRAKKKFSPGGVIAGPTQFAVLEEGEPQKGRGW